MLPELVVKQVEILTSLLWGLSNVKESHREQYRAKFEKIKLEDMWTTPRKPRRVFV